MVRVIPAMSPNWFLHRLADALGLRCGKTYEARYEAVAEYLEGREANLVVIVDEIDRASVELAHVIRTIQDESRCAMVWLGTSDFLTKLRLSGTGSAKQILRRIQFPAVLRGVSRADADAILTPYGIADAALRRHAWELAGGRDGRGQEEIGADARRLAKGIVMARNLARDAGESLRLDHITDGFQMLISAD
jgi:DNA transposition AAA+ family ATPase